MKAKLPLEPAVSDLKGWIVFIVLAFVWGGSFILIKKGLIHFSPIQVGSLRVFISALAFIPTYFIARVDFPKGKVLLIGLITFIAPVPLRKSPAVVVALIVAPLVLKTDQPVSPVSNPGLLANSVAAGTCNPE